MFMAWNMALSGDTQRKRLLSGVNLDLSMKALRLAAMSMRLG
jgi:hypothetical protein